MSGLILFEENDLYELCSSEVNSDNDETDDENFTLKLEDDPDDIRRSDTRRNKKRKRRSTPNGDKSYVCIRCEQIFTNFHNMKRHEKFYCLFSTLQTNTGKCIYCQELFSSRNSLIKHLMSIHKEKWNS